MIECQEIYSEPCQEFKMGTIFAICCLLDVWQGPEYASKNQSIFTKCVVHKKLFYVIFSLSKAKIVSFIEFVSTKSERNSGKELFMFVDSHGMGMIQPRNCTKLVFLAIVKPYSLRVKKNFHGRYFHWSVKIHNYKKQFEIVYIISCVTFIAVIFTPILLKS